MAEVKIYFNDLSEEIQQQIYQEVKQELQDFGEIAPKGRNETREEFERRLEEVADNYINTRNFAKRYVI